MKLLQQFNKLVNTRIKMINWLSGQIFILCPKVVSIYLTCNHNNYFTFIQFIIPSVEHIM